MLLALFCYTTNLVFTVCGYIYDGGDVRPPYVVIIIIIIIIILKKPPYVVYSTYPGQSFQGSLSMTFSIKCACLRYIYVSVPNIYVAYVSG